MRRVAISVVVGCAGVVVALVLRSQQTRAAFAPAGGSGTIEAEEVNVAPKFGGRLLKVSAEEGDRVVAGQVLAELECDDARAALVEAAARLAGARSAAVGARASALATDGHRAAAASAEGASRAQANGAAAQRERGSRDAARAEALFDAGVSAATAREEAQTRATMLAEAESAARAAQDAAGARVRAAAAEQDAARANARASEQVVGIAEANLLRAEAAARECKLVSPIDGVVIARNFDGGEVIVGGAPVVTVADLRVVEARFYLPNADLARAAAGMAVSAVADAHQGRIFGGRIASVSSRAEFTPRNIQTREDRDRLVYAVRARFPNPEEALRPGMPVEIQIGDPAR